jgi:hypothetical protein
MNLYGNLTSQVPAFPKKKLKKVACTKAYYTLLNLKFDGSIIIVISAGIYTCLLKQLK